MDSIRNFLQETLEKEKIAGMTVAVTDRNGLLFSEGFGVESVERPEVKTAPDALFRIASISKVVTGMTILSLVEEGLLSLDEPVKKYLPWLTLRDKETEAGVTLGHLLSHTSGLPTEYTPDGYREESALEPSLRAGLPELDLLFPLGRGYNYSNWGIRLASLVAEAVTGKKFTQLAQERVLTPLGMDRTTYDLHVAATYPISLPHVEENGSFRVCHRLQENAARHAAGGLYSSAPDLCKLARCLLNEGVADDGTRILSRASIEEMKVIRGKPENCDGYGITLFRNTVDDRQIYYHTGSAPPYATALVVHPESGLGVVVLMNTERYPLRHGIPLAIFNMLDPK